MERGRPAVERVLQSRDERDDLQGLFERFVAYVERQTDGAVHRGVGADRTLNQLPEVGDDVFEASCRRRSGWAVSSCCKFEAFLFDDHASGGLVEDQPFVGPERTDCCERDVRTQDRAAVERGLGDAAGAFVTGVERGAEHFDLHVFMSTTKDVRVARHFEIASPSSVTRPARMFRDRSGGVNRTLSHTFVP